jgi:ATP-binding cassette, subfamily B, bacterial
VVALVWRAAPAHLLVSVGLTVLGAATPVGAAWLLTRALDRIAAGRPEPGPLVWYAAGLAGSAMVAALVPLLSSYVAGELRRRTARLATDRLYAAVNRLTGLARLEDPAFLNRLRIAQDAARSAPSNAVTLGLDVVRGALTALGFVSAMLVLSPLLTVLVALAAVPAVVAELGLSRRRAALVWSTAPYERREYFYTSLLADVRAAKEIRLFGAGDLLRERLLAVRRRTEAAQRSLDRRALSVHSGLSALGAAVAGTGVLVSVGFAGAGRLSVGGVSMLVAALAGVQSALGGAVVGVSQVHHQLLILAHYRAVLATPPDPGRAPVRRGLGPLRVGVELRDVWFRYAEDQPWVLSGVHLFIPAGATVALVGRNGAGKSTLVKLLCRFYEPTRGAILWDGVDLRDVPHAALRERLTATFQDYMTYDFTAADNIGVADPPAVADRDRITAAATRAGVHDTIVGLPRGYDTMLSRAFAGDADGSERAGDERAGVTLSGGQWQRVALARAFLRDARDLLILDEPSAGLDAAAEHELHQRLRAYRAGRTSVLVTHRLGAVRDADLIVVLRGGRVVEEGDHAALLGRGGGYAELFRLQADAYGALPRPAA